MLRIYVVKDVSPVVASFDDVVEDGIGGKVVQGMEVLENYVVVI